MANTRIPVFAAAVLFCAQAFAQADPAEQTAPPPPPRNRAIAYKCVSADGTVIFSENPCSTDPKKVQEIDTSTSLKTGSGGHQRDIAASVADSDCRARARQAAYGTLDTDMHTSNDHIADYEARQQKASELKVYAPDGSGNLIDDPNAQQTIADLDALIAQEREFQRKANDNAKIAFDNAARGCDEQAAALQATKDTPPPPPQDAEKKQQ